MDKNLIDAADKHADNYEGWPIPSADVRTAITNAFYAGARFAAAGVETSDPGDLDPRMALDYAKRMKTYCEAFDGRDWANVMIHGSPDEQNLAHALDNLTECAAMLMNMAARVAAGVSASDGEVK